MFASFLSKKTTSSNFFASQYQENCSKPEILHSLVNVRIAFEQDDDRWIAKIPKLPGVLAYRKSHADTGSQAQFLQCVSR